MESVAQGVRMIAMRALGVGHPQAQHIVRWSAVVESVALECRREADHAVMARDRGFVPADPPRGRTPFVLPALPPGLRPFVIPVGIVDLPAAMRWIDQAPTRQQGPAPGPVLLP
eukprot:9506648-Alexandrium_andersonii.AAC.1